MNAAEQNVAVDPADAKYVASVVGCTVMEAMAALMLVGGDVAPAEALLRTHSQRARALVAKREANMNVAHDICLRLDRIATNYDPGCYGLPVGFKGPSEQMRDEVLNSLSFHGLLDLTV